MSETQCKMGEEVSAFAWLAVKLKIAELPPRVEWSQLFAASWLAGIGFTMALFIANTAFTDYRQSAAAKVNILIGSLLSGLIGFSLLLLTSRLRDRRSEWMPAPGIECGVVSSQMLLPNGDGSVVRKCSWFYPPLRRIGG